MKINTKVRYGLRTILELAKPENKQGILQKEIAVNQNLSIKYLDHIIRALKKKKLIINAKGKKSGYILAKIPSEISVYEIYQTFNNDINIIHCLQTNSFCEMKIDCCARNYWSELNETIKSHMINTKISELEEN